MDDFNQLLKFIKLGMKNKPKLVTGVKIYSYMTRVILREFMI